MKKTMNDELIKILKNKAQLSQGTHIEKMVKNPIRLLTSILLKYYTRFSKSSLKLEVTTFWGEKMFIIIPEVVSIQLYRYGYFEEGLSYMLIKYLKPGMTFYDIGTHYGYFTLLASHCVGDQGFVHSFEPTPSTYRILKENVENKKNVKLNNIAVFSKSSEVVINDYGYEYSAFNTLYEPRLTENIIKKIKPKKHKIEAISVDEYVNITNSKPNFIKIDAESAEFEILKGMEKTIKLYHPIITIEVGDYEINDIPKSKELVNYLKSKGYKAYEHSDGEIKAHDNKNYYCYDNILFLP